MTKFAHKYLLINIFVYLYMFKYRQVNYPVNTLLIHS